MRAYRRWARRQPRAWVALGAVVVAFALTVRDGRTGWTAFVLAWTGWLAAMSVRLRYDEEHPHLERQREERFQAEVDKVLWRYERQAAARERARVEADDGDSLGSRGTE